MFSWKSFFLLLLSIFFVLSIRAFVVPVASSSYMLIPSKVKLGKDYFTDAVSIDAQKTILSSSSFRSTYSNYGGKSDYRIKTNSSNITSVDFWLSEESDIEIDKKAFLQALDDFVFDIVDDRLKYDIVRMTNLDTRYKVIEKSYDYLRNKMLSDELDPAYLGDLGSAVTQIGNVILSRPQIDLSLTEARDYYRSPQFIDEEYASPVDTMGFVTTIIAVVIAYIVLFMLWLIVITLSAVKANTESKST